MGYDDDDFSDLPPEEQKKISEQIEFELMFYREVAGTDNVEVVAMPDAEGRFLSKAELELVQKECKRLKVRLLYRVSHGKVATVLDVKTHRVGVMPEYSSEGFSC